MTLNSGNNIDNDIANIFIAIFNDFNSQLQSNLKDEMNFIFGIKKMKTITLSQKSREEHKMISKQCLKEAVSRN